MGQGSASRTATSAGSFPLSARTQPTIGSSSGLSNAATCPSACTPASVRLAPRTVTSLPTIALTARSSSPAPVRKPG